MFCGAKLLPESMTQKALAGASRKLRRKSLVSPDGSETEGEPLAASSVELPLLLRQPPVVPAGALLPQGQSVHPI